MHRAYSLIEIREFNDETRTVEGMATTPTPDRLGDIVEPMGAKFKLPLSLLWQHSSARPVGEVFYAKPTDEGIAVKARIFRATESQALIDRLEEAWESVKLGLVRAFSIGFNPIEQALIKDTYSYRFTVWEWLELSLVTIPANAEATIDNVKSICLEQRAASGQRVPVRLDETHLRRVRRSTNPGVVYHRGVTGDGHEHRRTDQSLHAEAGGDGGAPARRDDASG